MRLDFKVDAIAPSRDNCMDLQVFFRKNRFRTFDENDFQNDFPVMDIKNSPLPIPFI